MLWETNVLDSLLQNLHQDLETGKEETAPSESISILILNPIHADMRALGPSIQKWASKIRHLWSEGAHDHMLLMSKYRHTKMGIQAWSLLLKSSALTV